MLHICGTENERHNSKGDGSFNYKLLIGTVEAQCMWDNFSGIWMMNKCLVQVVLIFGTGVEMLFIGIYL